MSEESPRQPRNRRFHLLFAVAVLVGALILLLVTEWASLTGRNDTEEKRSVPAQTGSMREPAAAPPRAFGVRATAPALPPAAERSQLADGLHQPAGTARDDVAIVVELLANYREFLRELPVGSNAEITAALAGDNPQGHAVLPHDHPAINAAGELTDRWGTPYFFHQLAADLMEVRCAGPDGRMHNADDVIWPAASGVAGPTSRHAEPVRSSPGRVVVADSSPRAGAD